ncbi:MAG: CotH kinase family protein [Prevotella sp.]|nr:CotH kinase family protein [Prevotella sp.]
MKYFLLLLQACCFWCASLAVNAQTPTLEELRAVGLPLVEVTTVDGEEPTCEYVSPPEGCIGSGITNATKVPGRLRIYDNGGYIYDSGDYEKGVSGMTIKIRGNSSAYEPKKPFKVKLQKKADLLCRGDAAYKDKDWLLLKDEWFVRGGKVLHMMIGTETARCCGMPWQPEARFVNLMVNGDYRGVYMLCESVKRNENCRLDVGNTGYIVEHDPYWWNEAVYFSTTRHEKKYTFKYPDEEDVMEEQIDYIRGVIDQMEEALWTGDYPSLVDVDSWATWLMAHDILGTCDAAGSNIFLTKYDDTPDSKVMMGPLWDFDTIMENENKWATIHDNFDYYFHYLLSMAPDKGVALREAYRLQWENVGQYVPDQMVAFLRDFAASDEAVALQTSNIWDLVRWGYDTWFEPGETPSSINDMVQKAIDWFTERKTWMDEHVPAMTTGIHTLSSPSASSSSTLSNDSSPFTIYDLTGRPVSPCHRGVIISEGKAYISK